MFVRCTNCHTPIELSDESSLSVISCPACGSSFSLVGDAETATYLDVQVRTVGHFELIEQLGIGAFGSVWKARDTKLDRIVAIKIPRKGQLAPAEVEQFLREARAAAQLKHPNIVSVHEVGRDGETVYIVSDFVNGVTLDDWLTGQSLTTREAAELCSKVAEALHHAHEQGVIHRDLKPANIMIDTAGEPHLMDFGLAKREAGEVTMTIEGRILGTPAYMSPEQAKGEGHQADRRTDIYSLGVVLYRLLTGELPFRGNTRMLLHQVLNEEPRSPRALNDRIPRDLETICLKALAKEPQRRFATTREMSEDLQRCLRGEPILSRPVSRIERAWRWTRRNPVIAGLTAAVAVSLIAGLIVSNYFAVRATREAEIATENANRADQNARQATENADLAERERAAAQLALDREQKARDAEAEQRKEAEKQREQAETNLTLAEKNLFQATRAVDEFFTLVSTRFDPQLAPDMEPLRKELLQSALKYYQGFVKDHADNQFLRAELAAANLRVGQIQIAMAEWDDALTSFEKGIGIYDQLLSEGIDASGSEAEFGGVFGHQFQMEGALQFDSQPSPTFMLRAIPVFLRARLMLERLAREFPNVEGYRSDLAGNYFLAGSSFSMMGQLEQAIQSMRKGADLLETLAAANPTSTTYLRRLSDHYGLMAITWRRRKPQSILPELPRIVSALDRFAKLIKDDLSDLLSAAHWYNEAAVCVRDASRPAEAAALHQQAIRLAERAVKIRPNNVHVRFKFGDVHGSYGRTLAALQRFDEASQELDKGLPQLRVAFEMSPENDSYRVALNGACRDMATVHRHFGHPLEAMSLLQECKKTCAGDAGQLYEIAAELALCIPTTDQHATVDQQTAEVIAAASIATLKEAITAGFTNLERLERDTNFDPVRNHVEFQDLLKLSKKRGSSEDSGD